MLQSFAPNYNQISNLVVILDVLVITDILSSSHTSCWNIFRSYSTVYTAVASHSQKQLNKFVNMLTDQTWFLSGPHHAKPLRTQPCNAGNENKQLLHTQIYIFPNVCGHIKYQVLWGVGVIKSFIFKKWFVILFSHIWTFPSERHHWGQNKGFYSARLFWSLFGVLQS